MGLQQNTRRVHAHDLRRYGIGAVFALSIVIGLTTAVFQSRAATASNRVDAMSDQTVDALALHQVSFNLSGTNTFAATETIAVHLPADFTQSGTWTSGDFTFTDGTARTVVDVDAGAGVTTVDSCAAGINNIGVAIDTTALVFTVVACPSYAASAAGAFVTFTIDGRTGNGMIQNPDTEGTQTVTITDGGGDCGSAASQCNIAVTIVESSGVDISATVPGGGGGGGGGQPPDTTPPVISDVQATGITSTGATITWTTNEAATSLVRYGLTTGYGSTSSQLAYVPSHSRSLTDLAEGTTYHYQVCSTDSPGNQACSGDLTFTTSDLTPPVISNVQVTSITSTGATITWTTDEASDSKVDHDTDGAPYATTTTNGASVTSHSVTLSGLTASTLYHFRVRSADAFLNESFTVDATFTTAAPADVTPPAISNVQVTNITSTGATITWTTNEAADSKVDHDIDGAPYAITTTNGASVTSHSVTLSGLTASTLYHFRVRSADASLNETASLDNTFVTAAPADVTPPVISNVTVVGITVSGATIMWTTDEAATRSVDYGLTTGYGSTAGTSSPLQTSHSVTLAGLTAGTLYNFRVRSADVATNSANGSNLTFTTLGSADTTPPLISNVQVTSITSTGATITWTTDEATTSRVEYDTDGSPYLFASANPTLVTSHSVALTGLAMSALHHFRVVSVDASGNQSASSNSTFTTVNPDAPVISNVQVTSITETGATITWTTNEASSSQVDHGTTTSYGQTTMGASGVTSHSVALTGLSPGTAYHFRVRSADPQNNSSTSADFAFATMDTSGPVISAVSVTAITENSAIVTWTTDESADSRVEYGTTVSYGSTATVITPVFTHQVDLTGLSPDTIYNYRVRSRDASTNESVSVNLTFTTAKPPPPVISNVQVTSITQTTAIVTWTTDVLADSKVDYGLTASYGNTRSDASAAVSHSVELIGLNMGTTYHFRVRSTGLYGDTTDSSDAMFFTSADTTPPAPASGFTAIAGNGSVSLSWTNPIDPDFDHLIIIRKTGSDPSGPSDGTQVYYGSGTSYPNVGLSNGTSYHYGAFAYDTSNNASTGSFVNATPSGPIDRVPPPNVENLVASGGDQEILLTWAVPSDPDWIGVKVQRKTGSYPSSVNDGITVLNATDTAKRDTGLTNGVTYYYRVFSFDGALNYSSGVNVAGIPSSLPDPVPPSPAQGLYASPGNEKVQLSWINPNDPDWAATRVVRRAGVQPNGPSDGVVVFDGIGDSWMDQGLTNGTRYFYAAYAYDLALNFAQGSFDDAIPEMNAVPEPLSCTDSDGGMNVSLQGTVSEGENVYQDICIDSASVREYACQARIATEHAIECAFGFKCAAGRCIADTVISDFEACGNGICTGSENGLNCPIDCPADSIVDTVTAKDPSVAEIERLDQSDIRFLVTKGRIALRAGSGGNINGYTRMAMTVYLPDESIIKPIETAYVNYLGKSYAMRQTASYEATMATSSEQGDHPLSMLVNYKDGTTDTMEVTMTSVPRGLVYETIDGEQVEVAGAQVTLLVDQGGGNYGVWNGASSGQSNPQIADDTGEYNYIVPQGTYKLRATKDGYITKETLPFPITDQNVINAPLVLFREPENVAELAGVAVGVATEQVREIVNNEIVEEQTRRVAPAAAAIAVANVASAGAATATAVPYLLYLYSFLAQPTLLIARRRRKQWGVVFDAITKEPVDLTIVRLVDAATGRIIRSMVTDKAGRYFFIARAGTYRITVAKAGFAFPTAYIGDKQQDARYADLYHGEDVTVEQEASITANIPIDPVEKEKTPGRVLWEGIGRRLQKSIGLVSIAAMAVAAVITPTPIVIAMLVGNIILYNVFRRVALGKQPKSWGIVYDEKTRRPIRNAIIRVFEAKYNKLLETQVTDIRGRYAFLVGNNVYYVTYERPGYKKLQNGPLDLANETDDKKKVIADDVSLEMDDTEGVASGKRKRKGSLLVPASTPASVSLPALGVEKTLMPPTPPVASMEMHPPSVPLLQDQEHAHPLDTPTSSGHDEPRPDPFDTSSMREGE